MSVTLDQIRQHWDRQAALGPLAGTQDLIAKELEQRAILAEVGLAPRCNGKVLEIGCGRGETAIRVALRYRAKTILAVDSSPAMIEAARTESMGAINRLTLGVGDALNPPEGPFDVIYTQRCLINLPTWELQKQAIDAIADRLVPGGAFLMCENSRQGLTSLSRARRWLRLEPLDSPWHNEYIDEARLLEVTRLRLVRVVRFSAAYYFLSRIVNARLHREPRYDSWINKLALRLPYWLFGTRWAQGRLFVWIKP